MPTLFVSWSHEISSHLENGIYFFVERGGALAFFRLSFAMCLIFHNAKMTEFQRHQPTTTKCQNLLLFRFEFVFSSVLIFFWAAQSVQTADALYSCDWQGKSNDVNYSRQRMRPARFDFPCDVEVMKSIKFTIKRAQKPLILMAMKFSALALNTFTRVSSIIVSHS